MIIKYEVPFDFDLGVEAAFEANEMIDAERKALAEIAIIDEFDLSALPQVIQEATAHRRKSLVSERTGVHLQYYELCIYADRHLNSKDTNPLKEFFSFT
jgi:hypothetical protein